MGVCIMAPITGWILIQYVLTWKPPIKFVLCHLFPQQVGGRILHHLVLPTLAYCSPSLPWHCHLCYQVGTMSVFHISRIFLVILHLISYFWRLCSDYENTWSRQLCAKCQASITGCPLSKMRNRFNIIQNLHGVGLKNWDHNCVHRPFPASFQSKRGISRG